MVSGTGAETGEDFAGAAEISSAVDAMQSSKRERIEAWGREAWEERNN